MPQSEHNAGRQVGLPVGVRRDDRVHQREQSLGVVLNLDIDIKLDVFILGLSSQGRRRELAPETGQTSGRPPTFINNSSVSANVGIDCWGSFNVRGRSIPLCQSVSLIVPSYEQGSEVGFPSEIGKSSEPWTPVVLRSSAWAIQSENITLIFKQAVKSLGRHEAKLTGVVEHDDDAIPRDMDVCTRVTVAATRYHRGLYRSRLPLTHRESHVRRTRACFQGKWPKPLIGETSNQWRVREGDAIQHVRELTPRWPQHS
jgi:hypothetical protein